MKKWKIVTLCALVLGGVCFTSAYVGTSRYVAPVYAVTEEIQEQTPQEDTDSKLQTFLNTYLIPILSSVSVTSIIGMFVSIVFAILNRKNNKDGKKNNEETNNNCTNVLNQILRLLDKLSASEKFEEDTKIFISNLMKELKTTVAQTNDVNAQNAQLKSMIVLLCQMFTEFVANNKEAVSSGTAKKISELQSKIALLN